MLHAASLCIRRDPQSRPRMSQVKRTSLNFVVMISFTASHILSLNWLGSVFVLCS